MTRRLFAVPAACAGRRSEEKPARGDALSCVWIETGNPQQPLARIWIDREVRIAGASEEPDSEREIAGAGRHPAWDGPGLVCA